MSHSERVLCLFAKSQKLSFVFICEITEIESFVFICEITEIESFVYICEITEIDDAC